jgi:hypothetical protein
MSDLRNRLTKQLEPVLLAPDPRPAISAYHDMPYALFRYDPDDELELRKELSLLATRIEQAGKRVTRISLAECLEEAMTSVQPLEDWFEAEKRQGTATVVDTIHAVLADHAPLDDLVAQRMPKDPDPLRDVVLIHRAGALFPVYRTFTLLGHARRRRRTAFHGCPRSRT